MNTRLVLCFEFVKKTVPVTAVKIEEKGIRFPDSHSSEKKD